MENAKQKAIRLAYVNLIGEEKYQNFKYDINFQDGTMKLNSKTKLPNNGIGFKFIATYVDYAIVIPKSLQGIETNNGWISIQSEKDFPSENIDCWFITKTENTYLGKCEWHEGELFFVKGVEGFSSDFITHYQPIVKPLKRIY